jgi:nucleotide-binding universal stress UspA family protein
VTYRHILVPTDGSPRSRAAIGEAARLARALRARLTGLFVVAEGVPTAFSGAKLYASGVLSRENRALLRREAQQALAEVERQAAKAGVPFTLVQRRARTPWRAMLATARTRRCDLIVVGSRGRGALKSALLGSQALKVLAHSRIPVLVCR